MNINEVINITVADYLKHILYILSTAAEDFIVKGFLLRMKITCFQLKIRKLFI